MKRVLVAGMVVLAAACGGKSPEQLAREAGTLGHPVTAAEVDVNCGVPLTGWYTGVEQPHVYLTKDGTITFYSYNRWYNRNVTSMQVVRPSANSPKSDNENSFDLYDYITNKDVVEVTKDGAKFSLIPLDSATLAKIKGKPLLYGIKYACGSDDRKNPTRLIDPDVVVQE